MEDCRTRRTTSESLGDEPCVQWARRVRWLSNKNEPSWARRLGCKVEKAFQTLRVSASLNVVPQAPFLPLPSSCLGPTCLKDRKDKVVFTGSESGEEGLR